MRSKDFPLCPFGGPPGTPRTKRFASPPPQRGYGAEKTFSPFSPWFASSTTPFTGQGVIFPSTPSQRVSLPARPPSRGTFLRRINGLGYPGLRSRLTAQIWKPFFLALALLGPNPLIRADIRDPLTPGRKESPLSRQIRKPRLSFQS